MNSILHPPITQIQDRLFGLSDELLLNLVNNAKSIPSAVRTAALEQPGVKQLLAELNLASEENITFVEAEIPLFIRDLIDRRCAVQSAQFDTQTSAGQILKIDQVKAPKNQLNWQLSSPLLVLLDKPTEQSSDIWSGWIVSPDTDYADYWDVLLEPCDEPFDPSAGIIQVWNPVHLWMPQASQVIAQLSQNRLQSIRAVASEFIVTENSDEVANPGFIAPRKTLHDFTVLTGTMLGNQQDPRHQYQQLYFKVAKAIKEPARIALSQLAPSFFNNCVATLSGLRDKLGQVVLVPDTLIPQAMSNDNEKNSQQVKTFKLEDYGLFITIREAPNDVLKISLQISETEGELKITQLEDDIKTEHYTLNQAQPKIILEIMSTNSNSLIIECTGKDTMEIPLMND
jgi:hypothetical protein